MPDAQRCELGGIPDKFVGRETGGLPPVIPKVGITAGKLRKKKNDKLLKLKSNLAHQIFEDDKPPPVKHSP